MDAEEQHRDSGGPSGKVFRIACAAILVLAAAVRIFGLDQVPPGLFCDEAGNGYNAYSLLTSGRDEDGAFLPLYIWSFGVSYKNPIFVYSAVPVVGLLGLSEFSIRLTAALWGVLGVAAMMWLGTRLFGRRGALWCGFFLALCPWHVHFSRVAFELIAVLPLFAAGFALLLDGVRDRPRRLVPAAILFALSLYAYAPAKMFVPLFLLGAGVLYARRLWAAGRWTLAGSGAAILTGLPLLIFDLAHRDRSGRYFAETTILRDSRTLIENAEQVAMNWATFFTRDFLLLYGDPLVRHSVPEVGQIYYAMAPLIVVGALWCLAPRRPEGKLLLWWLVLYPLAPSLMNEVPSASRGFIGVGALCALAAAGADFLSRLVGGRRDWALRRTLADGLVCLIAATTLYEAGAYAHRYFTRYPAIAASEFQYGYGEAIAAMEPARDDFDQLLLTTTEGNQPQIFPLFYNQYPARKWLETRNPGYLIIDPAEFGRYDPKKSRVLAALRERDLGLFDEVEVRERIYDPAGRQVFVVAELKERARFLREWLMMGPLDNSKGQGIHAEHFPPGSPSLDAIEVGGENVFWRRIMPQFTRIELHHFFRGQIEPSGREPVWACAYATTELVADEAVEAMLELEGNVQWVQVWLGGRALTDRAKQLGSRPLSLKLDLPEGRRQLLLKTCRGGADWAFSARLRGESGSRLPGVEALPVIGSTAPERRELPTQLVNGFARVVEFPHSLPGDSDYRGPSQGWVEHLYDANGALVWETDPAPADGSTAFVFTALMSRLPGRAHLWVDGRHALEFETGRFLEPKEWVGNGFALRFLPRRTGDYHSGVWILYVPGELVKAGSPVRIRVSHVGGHYDSSFMLKGRTDTIEHEKLDLAVVRESL